MATFRKKRSRQYKRRNTRRNTRRNMRKSHIKRRGKKSLVGGDQDEAGQAWWNNEKAAEESAATEKAAAEAATAKKKEIVDKVIAEFNMSREDAINVAEIMKEGYEMNIANNIYSRRLEMKEILKKQAELEAAKEAAAAKSNIFYRSIFGKPYVTPDPKVAAGYE